MTQHVFGPSLEAVVLISAIIGVSLYVTLRGFRQKNPELKALMCTMMVFAVGLELVLNSAHTLVESDDWMAPYRTATWHGLFMSIAIVAYLAIDHAKSIGFRMSQGLMSWQLVFPQWLDDRLYAFRANPCRYIRFALATVFLGMWVAIYYPAIITIVGGVWTAVVEMVTSMAGPVQLNSRWSFAPPAGIILLSLVVLSCLVGRISAYTAGHWLLPWLRSRLGVHDNEGTSQ